MGRSYDEWSGVVGNKSKIEKTLVGKVVHYYPKSGVALVEITGDKTIADGDNYGIIGNTTGIVRGKIEGMLVNDSASAVAKKGDEATFKVASSVRKNDELYIFKER